MLVIAPGAYRRAQQAQAAAVPDDGAEADASSGLAPEGLAGWEPDLEAAWETAALAVGEAPGDEESDLAWPDTADFTEGTDE